jgi:hypothetical protein
MQSVKFDEFLDDVAPEVPGCPKITIISRLRMAAIDFCKETGVSVWTVEGVDLDAGEAVLTLPVPGSFAQVWQVVWAKTNNGPVTPLHRSAMIDRGIKWEGLTGRYPLNFVHHNPREIMLIPTPEYDLPGALTLHCSYIPTRNAKRVDARLLDEYREAIAHGALARLLKMRGEDWYDGAEAQERSIFFEIAKSEARAVAAKDFQAAEQHVRMSPLA